MKSAADTAWIVERAQATGFSLCGVTRADKFPELAQEEWLARGYAGEMKYLADPRRTDPEKAMTGVRSIVVCALNYNTSKPPSTEAMKTADLDHPRGWLSRYAWGRDYHEVLSEKLELLHQELCQRFTESFEVRIYADTGPIQERIFAKHAGMGWLGKNTLLLNQEIGSFFFLGVILTTLDLKPSVAEAESLAPDRCGTCQRCIEACPTGALLEPYVMDARKCISYLTIELRGGIPADLREAMGRHVYGCDICQDVCPWNSESPISGLEEFQPRLYPGSETPENSLFMPSLEWLLKMTEAEFREVFKGSSVRRTKWRGLVRNACIALGNSALRPENPLYENLVNALQKVASLGDAAIKESALWALARIQSPSKQAQSF